MPKPFVKFSAIVIFLAMAVYALLFVPLYSLMATDVNLERSILFDIVDVLMQWSEIFSLTLLLAVLLVGGYRLGSHEKCKPIYKIALLALLFKYVTAIATLSIINGTLDLTMDYSGYVFSLLIEGGICVFVAILTVRTATTVRERKKAIANARKRLGDSTAPEKEPFPFASPFERHNPLLRVAAFGVGAVTAFRVLAFIGSEIAFVMMGFTYKLSDLPVSLFYIFLLCLLPSFLAYLLLWRVTNKLDKKLADKK